MSHVPPLSIFGASCTVVPKASIRNTHTQYAIRSPPQSPDTQYAYAIRNTQPTPKPRYAIRIRNTQYAARVLSQSSCLWWVPTKGKCDMINGKFGHTHTPARSFALVFCKAASPHPNGPPALAHPWADIKYQRILYCRTLVLIVIVSYRIAAQPLVQPLVVEDKCVPLSAVEALLKWEVHSWSAHRGTV